MVGMDHAVAFDVEYRRVDVTARAVVVGGVHVDHQWLARHLLGVDAGRICEPVVRVDYVAVDRAGYHSGHDRVVVDFLEQVVGVAAREFDAAQVVGAHVVEVGVDVVAEPEIEVGIHHAADTLLDVVAADVAPCHRHLRRAYDVGE